MAEVCLVHDLVAYLECGRVCERLIDLGEKKEVEMWSFFCARCVRGGSHVQDFETEEALGERLMGLQCWQDLGEKEVEIGDEREFFCAFWACCPEVEKNHGVSPDVGENLRISLARQKPDLYSIQANMKAKHCQEKPKKKKVVRQQYKVANDLTRVLVQQEHCCTE